MAEALQDIFFRAPQTAIFPPASVEKGTLQHCLVDQVRFLLIENGSYSNTDCFFFSRCSRKIAEGIGRRGLQAIFVICRDGRRW